MAWDGTERRVDTAPYQGSDRRRPARERFPENLARFKDEQMLDQIRQRRRERYEDWDVSEFLE